MNLFDDVAVKIEESKNPRDWTIEDCKQSLSVIFRESTKHDLIDVSVRLHGLTMLKIYEGKTTLQIAKGSLSKQEIRERVQGSEEMLLEAKDRLIQSLNKARTSREINYKRKPKNAVAPKIEKGSQEFSQLPYSMQ
jgi:hypothetical protein